MQPDLQRDINEVITVNLLKTLFTGKDYSEETNRAITKYEISSNIAKKMLQAKIDIATISSCTSLPIETIQQLQEKLDGNSDK